MMKQTFLSLTLVLALAQPALAATKKKKTTVKTEAPAAVAAPAPAIEQSSSSSSNSWTPSASFGLGAIGSNFNLGVMGSYMTDVTFQDTSFKAGVKTGFLLGLGDVGTWVIPVMGSATYTFSNGGSLKPYLGVDLGIGIAHAVDTTVKFAALIYPGAQITDEIFAELPFGSMSGGFIIFPSVGMRF
jgi:hypothetical protein